MNDDSAEQLDDPEPVLPPRRRRPQSRRAVYTRPVNRGRLIITLLFVGFLFVSGAVYRHSQTLHYAVLAGKKPLVYVANKAEARRIIAEVKESIAPGAPDAVTFKEGELRVQALTTPDRLMKRDTAIRTLKTSLTPIVKGAAIYVNGRPLVAVASKEHASRTIALMQQRGLGGQQGLPTIKQRVTIGSYTYEPRNRHGISLMTPEKAAEFLVHPPVARMYTVQSGDSFWSIGNAHGLSVKQLKEQNPGVDPARLKKGDQLKLPPQPSPVTIVVRPRAK
ncbi:MAG: LysM peptidoglycan-binding domain-containing protein [Armatimonadota bacterium]